jgi:S-DNA-T family DNA segregation ATPase FtsK/SpoIIIE
VQRELWGVALVALGLVTAISLFTSAQGKLSEAWALFLRRIFGVGAYPVALLMIAVGVLITLSDTARARVLPHWKTVVGAESLFFCLLALIHALARGDGLALARAGRYGGYIGWTLSDFGTALIGRTLTIILFALLAFGSVLLATNTSWATVRWRVQWALSWVGVRLRAAIERTRTSISKPAELAPRRQPERVSPALQVVPEGPAEPVSAPNPKPRTPLSAPVKRSERKPARRDATPVPVGLPSLDLLVPDEVGTSDDADARERAQVIEDTLGAFGIPAQVVEWSRGPVVTQFGVEPGYYEKQDREGEVHRFKIRVSKILALSNDLALALAAAPIRIEAPVPGRALVGIEVPNAEKTLVGLRSVLESKQFAKIRSPLRVALGRDVAGEAVVANLGAMPHLLIAGATNSGKSVCLNAIIASLLFQNTPEELKLLMVDPKRVELTNYNGIPHLLAPVVTDVDRVIVALRWLTREMDRRYARFAEMGVRNLAGYHKLAERQTLEPLPFIVLVIDELADLMLAAPEDVERTICRLAQMARATGIHLAIATQRPSVDVVTGLIKANFPARISFAVTSQVDSRVVLDTPGAEKLLGHGDMLFMAPDSPKLQRIQGCFASDKELEALVAHWRAQATVSEADEQPAPWDGMEADEEDSDDELLQQAIDLVRDHQQASASFLQRQMRIGYPRAARIIDQLEKLGVVGAPETGGRSRSVLSTVDEDDEPPPIESADPDEP